MIVPDLKLVLVSTSSIDPGSEAHDHANNVYGMLQQMIRTIDSQSSGSEDSLFSQR
jgi:hypothetical protein